MPTKSYYSLRSGKRPGGDRLDLDGLKYLCDAALKELGNAGYFQQAFGIECVDVGYIPGAAGQNVEVFFFKNLHKRLLWPIPDYLPRYSEEDLFDVLELLHDCAAKGVQGEYHSWRDCGWHYKTFDRVLGQNEFRLRLNEVLKDYDCGYQLTGTGQIVTIAPSGLGDLEHAPAPPGDPENVRARMEAAVQKFRQRGATMDQRRDRVRDLADILEFLRAKAKLVLTSKDEADLFNIANNFEYGTITIGRKLNMTRLSGSVGCSITTWQRSMRSRG